MASISQEKHKPFCRGIYASDSGTRFLKAQAGPVLARDGRRILDHFREGRQVSEVTLVKTMFTAFDHIPSRRIYGYLHRTEPAARRRLT